MTNPKLKMFQMSTGRNFTLDLGRDSDETTISSVLFVRDEFGVTVGVLTASEILRALE